MAALSSCGDEENIIIEPESTQAEINIQKLESFEVTDYRFHSSVMGLNGSGTSPAVAETYSIESPYIVVSLYGNAYRFNMNQLIAFSVIMNSLHLYFP